jgi:membrane protein implicated in regulation of membrane protease activity
VLIGRAARVTQGIDPVTGSGRVLVAGEDWAASSASPLPAGAAVEVTGADGIVLQVVAQGLASRPVSR